MPLKSNRWSRRWKSGFIKFTCGFLLTATATSWAAAAEVEPRKTLLQWSYGTSFEGGPDRDEPLVADRPDFTEASTTVGLGVVQLETGYTYTRDEENGRVLRSHSYPETLLRVGALAEWLELRFAWNYLHERVDAAGGSDTVDGAEDLELGVKLGLTPQECLLPETALILEMAVPTGADAFSAAEVLPGVTWIYGWELNDWISTAGQTRFSRALDEATEEPYVEVAQSWTIGYSLTERVGAYTEWFAIIPSGADTEATEYYFDGGFTYLVHNDLQLDFRSGVGLNDAADDYFVGSGAVFRF